MLTHASNTKVGGKKTKSVIKSLTKKNLERKLWDLCRKITIHRYEKNGTKTCFTCGKVVEGGSVHIGHFIPRSVCGASLKYDLRNLRIQCPFCNTFCGGNGAQYYKNLVSSEGQDFVDKLFQDKQRIVKAEDYWINQLKEYEIIYEEITRKRAEDSVLNI